MQHSNLDLLNRKYGKSDFSSEHYLLQEAIDLRTKTDWQAVFKSLREELTPSAKKFKKELNKKFNKITFRPK